jgi:two-component system, OmpR family, phosphate regulon response regulator PhoB
MGMARVLVVDDDADINAALQESLRIAGYEVAGVQAGGDALVEVARRCPDLVLLDQMLPDIDGVEVCRRLRSRPETKRVPIMFLTARGGEAARVDGLALGADDYVVKPFSMPELLLRIRAVLRRATPVELRLPPEWVRLREQFRIWNSYAQLHVERGEWRECLELSRRILRDCDPALSAAERGQIYQRLSRCAQGMGDETGRRAWSELARTAL